MATLTNLNWAPEHLNAFLFMRVSALYFFSGWCKLTIKNISACVHCAVCTYKSSKQPFTTSELFFVDRGVSQTTQFVQSSIFFCYSIWLSDKVDLWLETRRIGNVIHFWQKDCTQPRYEAFKFSWRVWSVKALSNKWQTTKFARHLPSAAVDMCLSCKFSEL